MPSGYPGWYPWERVDGVPPKRHPQPGRVVSSRQGRDALLLWFTKEERVLSRAELAVLLLKYARGPIPGDRGV